MNKNWQKVDNRKMLVKRNMWEFRHNGVVLTIHDRGDFQQCFVWYNGVEYSATQRTVNSGVYWCITTATSLLNDTVIHILENAS